MTANELRPFIYAIRNKRGNTPEEEEADKFFYWWYLNYLDLAGQEKVKKDPSIRFTPESLMKLPDDELMFLWAVWKM